MRIRMTAAAAIFVLAAPALAAQARSATAVQRQASPPRARFVTAVEGISEYALPNGLRVVLFPDETKPTLTVNVTYNVGSLHEGAGEAGMAHLLEHLLLRGLKKYPDINASYAERGVRRNGATTPFKTYYFETVAASDANLDWALDLEADRMVNALVEQAALDKEFSVVLNEMELGESDMWNTSLNRLMRTMFHVHGYGRTTIGTRSDIENVSLERLRRFYRRYYQPDNATLIVAGRFDPARALPVIERKFGVIPRPARSAERGNLLAKPYTVEPTQDGERFSAIRRSGDAQLVVMGYHVPAAIHPDYAALEVLADVLGSNPSGRLYKALVDTKQASTLEGDIFQAPDPSLMYYRARLTRDQSLDTVRARMERMLDSARTSTFTEQEVARARTSLLRNIELAMSNSERGVFDLSDWSSQGDWRLWFLHRDRLAKVTVADVQRVAAQYLKPSNRSTVAFIPTDAPDRAVIPVAPSVATALAGFKGGEAIQAGEAFDATAKNIEARLRRATLPSGMHVALLPKRTRAARVSGQVVLRHGTETSLAGKAQVAALTIGMLARGTTALTRQQVVDSMSRMRSAVSVQGTLNSTIVIIETTRPYLIPVLELVAQQLRSPRFDPEELERLKKERVLQQENARSNPVNAGQLALSRALSNRPRGHPQYVGTVDETIAEIQAVTIDAVRAMHRSEFGAGYGDIALAGDFDAAAVLAAATRLFGDWKSPQPYARLVRTASPVESTFVSVETPDKANASYQIGTILELSDADPDYPAMAIAHYILGSADNSRFVTRLRTREGISYGSAAFLTAQSQDRYATWSQQSIGAPQNIERTQRAVREEIDSALKYGFSPAEVEQAKTGYLLRRHQSRANDNELVPLLITRRNAGRTMAFDEEFERTIRALTADQVSAALRKYIDPRRLVIAQAGDFAKNPPVKATP